jgi:hypothetical protein
MVCKLNRSNYGLKQVSRIWNIRCNETVNSYGCVKNVDKPCVYRKLDGENVSFLVLYIDDILLIGNDVGILLFIKVWLSNQFNMKYLGDANYILGIKLLRDKK